MVKRGQQKNFVLIQNVSETAAKLNQPNLKTVQDMVLLAHADHLIDDDECLLLYDLNRSKKLELPYQSYEIFDLDSLSKDECKSSLDSIKGTYTGCVIFFKFQKKLGALMEWFSTEKKFYVFS